jgi:hypothetical protein
MAAYPNLHVPDMAPLWFPNMGQGQQWKALHIRAVLLVLLRVYLWGSKLKTPRVCAAADSYILHSYTAICGFRNGAIRLVSNDNVYL